MSFKLQSRPNAPHAAVLFIRAEVHEVQADGHLSGRPVHKVEPFVLELIGEDLAICVRKLNEALAEMRDKCKTS